MFLTAHHQILYHCWVSFCNLECIISLPCVGRMAVLFPAGAATANQNTKCPQPATRRLFLPLAKSGDCLFGSRRSSFTAWSCQSLPSGNQQIWKAESGGLCMDRFDNIFVVSVSAIPNLKIIWLFPPSCFFDNLCLLLLCIAVREECQPNFIITIDNAAFILACSKIYCLMDNVCTSI